VTSEVTRGDVTAITVFQATLPVPGRVIPNDPDVERSILLGERLFDEIRCTTAMSRSCRWTRGVGCIRKRDRSTPVATCSARGACMLAIDLTDDSLPLPRLRRSAGNPDVIHVPAYTDLKLHDITDPADDTWKEPLDINQLAGSAPFFQGESQVPRPATVGRDERTAVLRAHVTLTRNAIVHPGFRGDTDGATRAPWFS
jgi:hypothetical protein